MNAGGALRAPWFPNVNLYLYIQKREARERRREDGEATAVWQCEESRGTHGKPCERGTEGREGGQTKTYNGHNARWSTLEFSQGRRLHSSARLEPSKRLRRVDVYLLLATSKTSSRHQRRIRFFIKIIEFNSDLLVSFHYNFNGEKRRIPSRTLQIKLNFYSREFFIFLFLVVNYHHFTGTPIQFWNDNSKTKAERVLIFFFIHVQKSRDLCLSRLHLDRNASTYHFSARQQYWINIVCAKLTPFLYADRQWKKKKNHDIIATWRQTVRCGSQRIRSRHNQTSQHLSAYSRIHD